jgi:hypothetical protein
MKPLLVILLLAFAGCSSTAPTPAGDSRDPDRWKPRNPPVYPMP